MTPEDQATAFVIDDDARMRTALPILFSLESQNSAQELHEMKKKTNMCVHEISNIYPDP